MTASCAHSLAPTARAVYDQQRDLLRLLDTGAVPLDVAKVFVCGDYGIGKTTLIKTLETSRHRASLFQPRDRPDTPSERTQGVQMKQLRLQHQPRAGRTPAVHACFQFFDFGGHATFHVIHTLLVSDWTAAFVVCVDLSKSHEELRQSLWYWLRFIATRVKQSRETLFASELQNHDAIDKRPRVILVGTKVDKCHASHRLNTNDGSSQRLTSCVHTAGSTFGSVLNIVTSGSLIALNCFRGKDNGFEMLKERLAQHWMAIKRRALVVPRIVSEVSTMLEAIRNETTLSTSIDEVLLKMRAMHAGFLAMGDTLSPDLFRATLR